MSSKEPPLAEADVAKIHLDSAALARAWAVSAEIVRFDERVHGLPTPLPGVLLWGEVTAGRRPATAEAIATARLLRWSATLPHGTQVEPEIIDTVNATDQLRSAVNEPAGSRPWPQLSERPDLPPLAEVALLFAALEDATSTRAEADQSGFDQLLARRVQVHRVLRSRGLTRNSVLPIVAGVQARAGGIESVVAAWRHGAHDTLVEAFAESAVATIETGVWLAGELRRVHEEWADRIGARHDSSAWRLADLLVEQPVVNAASVSARLAVTQTAARTSIAALVDVGVLEPISSARRNQAWRAPAVLAVADAILAR